jgi:3-deoxy-manno-octulosonate cytidylyltransferase (CMP-KDO synthetase)
MHNVIVIPARLESTRLPHKPLENLGGAPLIARTVAQAKKCRRAERVLVATDATEVAEAVRAHGGDAVLTRADHQSGTDRVAEAIEDTDAELIVNLQGDEPFVEPSDLDALFGALDSVDADMATLRAPIETPADWLDPNVVKVVTRNDGTALYFSRAPIPFDRSEVGGLETVFRHVGVYGYRRAALSRLSAAPTHALERRERLEQLRALALGMRITVLDARTRALGIDTHEDLTRARMRVNELGEAAFP